MFDSSLAFLKSYIYFFLVLILRHLDLSDFETVAFMGVRRRGTSSSHPPLNPAALSSRRRQRASTAAVSGHIRSAVAGSHPSAAATATATRPPSSPAEWLAQRLDGDGDHSSGGLFPESIAHFFPLGALRIDGADLFDERMHTARLSNLSLPPPRSGVADTSAVAGNASHSSSSRKSSLDNTSSQHTTTAPASPFSVLVAAATVERAAELELSWQYSKPVDAIDASALRAHEIWRFVPPSMRAALGAATAVAANANASVTAIDGNARVAPTTTTMKTTTTIHARVCDEILDRPAVIMPRASSSLSLNFERTNRNGAERTNDSANDGDCDADDVDSDDDLDDFSVADLSTLVLLLLFVFQSLVGACDRLAAVVRTLRGGRRRRQQSATSHDTLVALLALLACAPALPSFTSVLASVSGFPLLAIFTLESWSGVHWMGALSATALTCGSYAWAMLQFAQRAAVSLLLFVVAHKCRPNAAAASASASASATGQLSSSLSISASLALDEASWVDRHQRLCRALRRPFGPDLSRGAQRPLRNLLRRFVRSLALLVAAAGRALPLPLFDWSDAAGAIGALSHVCLFAAVWSLAGLSLAPVVAALALWVFVRRSRAFVALVTFLRGVDRVLLRPYAHAAVEVYATTAAPAMGQLTNHY